MEFVIKISLFFFLEKLAIAAVRGFYLHREVDTCYGGVPGKGSGSILLISRSGQKTGWEFCEGRVKTTKHELNTAASNEWSGRKPDLSERMYYIFLFWRLFTERQ